MQTEQTLHGVTIDQIETDVGTMQTEQTLHGATIDQIETDVGTLQTENTLIGATVDDIEERLPIYVTCVVLHSTVVSGGINLTAASSGGAAWLSNVVVLNGATVWNSGANGAVFEMYSDNVDGAGSFMVTTEASLEIADVVVDLHSAATKSSTMVLETGKLIKLKSTTENFTSNGLSTIMLQFQPLVPGVTIAAGTGCQ